MNEMEELYRIKGAYHVKAYETDEAFTKYIDSIVDFFDDKKGKTILDVGAGEGLVTELLLERGHTVDALDISERARAMFHARKIHMEHETYFYVADFLDFKNKYDWILFANTLHWIEDEKAAVKKVKELAKEGAYIVTTNVKRDKRDLRAYTSDQLEKLFPSARITLQDGLRWVIIWRKKK